MIARGDMMSVDDVIEILAVDLIGTIPDDEQIVVAANQGEPLSGKKSQAEEEYKNICRRLLARRFHLWKSAGKKACSAGWDRFSENNFMIAEKGGYSVENRFTGKRPLRRLCQRQNENASGVGTDRLLSTDDENAEKRYDTYSKKYITIDETEVKIRITQEPPVFMRTFLSGQKRNKGQND